MSSADPRILWVDDELNLLEGIRRTLGRDYPITTVSDPFKALEVMEKEGPFAVIVSDFKMPNLDGIRLLSAAHEFAPDSVRILLTGYANERTAIEAVNEGHIFRFLSKPCTNERLRDALNAGLKQYRLVTAERDLLESTVQQCVGVLLEMVGWVSPAIAAFPLRMAEASRTLGEELAIENPWELQMAARLALLGSVTLPSKVMEKHLAGEAVTEAEWAMIQAYPSMTVRMIRRIARFEGVAAILEQLDCPMAAQDSTHWSRMMSARIIAALREFYFLLERGRSPAEALESLRARPVEFDPMVVGILSRREAERREEIRSVGTHREVDFSEIEAGMMIGRDLVGRDGTLYIRRGTVLTATACERLRNLVTDRVFPHHSVIIEEAAGAEKRS